MSYLYLGPRERQRLSQLKAYGLQHRIDLATVKRMAAGRERPVGDDANYVVNLSGGYRLVYSVEEQPSGWFQHLSVSVKRRGRYPLPEAIQMLQEFFGMSQPAKLWLEEEVEAVNILAPLDSILDEKEITHASE